MKKFLSLTLLGLCLLGCQSQTSVTPSPSPSAVPTASTSTPSPSAAPELAGALQADLQTEKPSYAVGEKVKVTVIAVGLTDSAWVWMVPDEVEVKPTARPEDSPHPHPIVGTNSTVEVTVQQPGRYQLYLFPSSELSAPLASRAVEIQ